METFYYRIIEKNKDMTCHEILKADVLDIIFDNRNKTYGAYELRKHYNNRLGMAIDVMLCTVLLIAFSSNFFQENRIVFDDILPDNTIKLVELKPDEQKPEVPDAPKPKQAIPVAQQRFTNQIKLVEESDKTDMPDQAVLTEQIISTQTVDGPIAPDPNQSLSTPAPIKEESNPKEETKEEFLPMEKEARYPGGQQAWLQFLQRYLHTPEELETGTKRTVLVRFSVGTDGVISQFAIVQSGGEAFDKEVIRVMKKMPRWEPAVQNGHKVAVIFTQPVTFMAVEE